MTLIRIYLWWSEGAVTIMGRRRGPALLGFRCAPRILIPVNPALESHRCSTGGRAPAGDPARPSRAQNCCAAVLRQSPIRATHCPKCRDLGIYFFSAASPLVAAGRWRGARGAARPRRLKWPPLWSEKAPPGGELSRRWGQAPAPIPNLEAVPYSRPAKPRHTIGRCTCGQCRTCQENARWEHIFQEKFANADYYRHDLRIR